MPSPPAPPATMAGYPPIPPASNLSIRHPLLEKCTFEQLHYNDVIETRPHTLHFGGFQIHKEHTNILKVVNTSRSSIRVSVIGPTTQWFKINFDKKGLLAPGMSEDITVTFEPHEWRYYYDTIKIFCGEQSENLVVPIHAYPSANDIVLPGIIDFGKVAIGTQRTKIIPLSCKIPIQFEFEITVLEAHPDLTVSPTRGVIPAHGSTEIVLTFHPTQHRTARTELEFNIAQFDFDPVKVSVVGSCLPAMSKDEVLRCEDSELGLIAAHKKQEKISAKIRNLQGKSERGPLDVRHPTHKTQELERTVNGVKVPTTRQDPTATNFILNQTAGKLPLKDLFNFIKEQREAADNRQKWAAKEGGGDSDGEPQEGEYEDKQAVELRFELRYREVDKRDKDKELKSTPAVGEEPPSDEVKDRVREARKRRHENLMKFRMSSDVGRVESVLTNAKVIIPSNYKPIGKPEWDENANDTFSVRLQVIERFVRAGSKVLMRVRAQKRCKLLREALEEAGVTDRGSCRAWVEAETKAAATGTGMKNSDKADKAQSKKPITPEGDATKDKGEVDTIHIPKDFVLPLQTPTALSAFTAEERAAVDVIPLDNFEEFEPVDINVRLDYKVLQYENYVIPPPSAYMRPNSDRRRLHAALEEHLILGERGDAFDGAEKPLSMPETCILAPEHDALSLLIPPVECRTYVAFPESNECDPEYRLSQLPSLIEPMKTEPLLPPNLMSLETPWLEFSRSNRQIADPFQYFDPYVGNFAEGGQPSGPRISCDVGGTRLSYMPVGGFERDLPSDTDDDEQPDLEVPPPGQDDHEKALQSLDGEVKSEFWGKEKALETHLREVRASNDRAVRDRLHDLNIDLNYRNKLYLG
eukprot:TRINITY_DN21929_c0_g1_i1.p1 TRINITY_DN21929_c0_g1~~TRINITY_DN21929_c0_g1_i1.p1  ORF type:complete len:866 (-),score=170.53 TRINITY_DN21929_c0_g1_i1:27-2624(-)